MVQLTAYLKNEREKLVAAIAAIDKVGTAMAKVRITKHKGPDIEPQAGDVFIGNMPSDIKRLCAVVVDAADHLGDVDEQCQKAEADEELLVTLQAELKEAAAFFDMCSSMLVMSIETHFPKIREMVPRGSVNKPEIVCAVGWQVYLRGLSIQPPSQPRDAVHEFLMRRFGGTRRMPGSGALDLSAMAEGNGESISLDELGSRQPGDGAMAAIIRLLTQKYPGR